jgi:TetR/AcrR family transcriptional regulator, transcriptional repressor for nem operon
MRYGADQKARTRERVLKEAMLTIRVGGPEGLGVAEVMKRAGLTHGGFYAHFPSREALLTAAVDELFSGARGVFDRRTAGLPPRRALRAYIDFYLSKAHREARESGCALPLLFSDMPRMTQHARDCFALGLTRLSAAVAARLREIEHPEPEPAAASALAEMVGALGLARAIGPGEQSDELLSRAHASICSRLGLEVAA